MSGALPITIYFCLVGQRHTLLNRIVFLVSCCGYYCCLLRLFGWWCFIIFSTTIVSLFSLAVSSPAVRAINFNLKHIFIERFAVGASASKQDRGGIFKSSTNSTYARKERGIVRWDT